MKIASFNVNSINVRSNNLYNYLKKEQPDIICLQEIKSINEKFPSELFSDLGYNIYLNGQKTYNGVAIFSKTPGEEIITSLPFLPKEKQVDFEDLDHEFEQARYIETLFFPKEDFPLRVVNVYCPNGNPVDTNKYSYKLAWMERLYHRAKELLEQQEYTVILGDFNIIKTALDAKNPERFIEDALFLPQSLNTLRAIENLGFTDSYRIFHPNESEYSYWDYQGGAYQKNNGIRIDLALTSPRLTDKLIESNIDKYLRGQEKPSDHVPIWIEFATN